MNNLLSTIAQSLMRAGHWAKRHAIETGLSISATAAWVMVAATYRDSMPIFWIGALMISAYCFLNTFTLRRQFFPVAIKSGWPLAKSYIAVWFRMFLAKRVLTCGLFCLVVMFMTFTAVEYMSADVNYIGLLWQRDAETMQDVSKFMTSMLEMYSASASLGILLGISALLVTLPASAAKSA